MSDQKRKRQCFSTQLPENASIQSASSSSLVMNHVDEGNEIFSELSKNKTRSSGRANRKSCNNTDRIKKIVQEEGRIARNLVTWNVPLQNSDRLSKSQALKTSGPSSPVKKSFSFQPHSPYTRNSSVGGFQKIKDIDQRKIHKLIDSSNANSQPRKCNQINSSKRDIRARYWAYLFENLHHAVDEIYQTCEADESVVECKEVNMMLDQYRQDFNSLIGRLHLMKDYEKGDVSRKKNVAWEVRKRSPSKSLMMGYRKDKSTNSLINQNKSTRFLTFSNSNDSAVEISSRGSLEMMNLPEEILTDENMATVGGDHLESFVVSAQVVATSGFNTSWADKVRNLSTKKSGVNTRTCNQSIVLNTKDQNINKTTETSWININNPHIYKHDSNKAIINKSKTNNEADKNQAFITSPVHVSSDAEGWEIVYNRNGKQRQKITPDIRMYHHQHPTLTSKSLQSIPSLEKKDDGHAQVMLFSSSPIIFSPPAPSPFLLQMNVEDKPLSIDTSVFCKSGNGDSNHKDNILKVIECTTCIAEPNSETIFANHYQDNVSLLERPKVNCVDIEDDEYLSTALMHALKEEDNLDNLLDEENEAALESAMEEEKSYLQEIEREEGEERMMSYESELDWNELVKNYEEEKSTRKLETWGEIMEEARTPGRLVHMFEKLSSPSRRRPTIENRQQLDEKLAKAAELREKTMLERGENLRILRKKVEDIQSLKNELMDQARMRMEKKLKRAEEKRQILLQMKVKKAHEEDTKASEIAFINTLEAQNRRHEIMVKHQESEARLQDMQEERQRKHEEKAAKEVAAEERRRALEAERTSRLQEMQDRRKQRETDFEQRQQEKEKERLEAARARDREREERLTALNKQQQAHIEELQKKIQQKQDETDRRHKEKLEAIQEKAFRMSLQHHSNDDEENCDAPPRMIPYEIKKFCSVCNVLIPSEVYLLSHLRGKTHQQAICDSSQGNRPSPQEIEKFNLQHIFDAPNNQSDRQSACEKERIKVLKKRCKKLKMRIMQRSNDCETAITNKVQNFNSQNKNKLQKIVNDLQKCINVSSSGQWAQSRVSGLDRCLGEISRLLEKNVSTDKVVFKSLGGLNILFQLLETVGHPSIDLPGLIPNKSLLLLTSVLKMLCLECSDVCQYLLLSNKICTFIDLISQHLNVLIPDGFLFRQIGPQCKLIYDQFSNSLIELLAAILLPFNHGSKVSSINNNNNADNNNKDGMSVYVLQAHDVVSYIVSIGILDKISIYFNNVRGSIDNDEEGSKLLQSCLVLLTSLVGTFSPQECLIKEVKKCNDPTQLILTLKVTQLVGIVSLMYGILLHSDAPTRSNNHPSSPLPKHTLDLTFLGFQMLNQVACLNLSMFQSSLGAEGTSLEFRHISSYLLWYCNGNHNDLLLHEIILCLGYFGLLNPDNQLIIQSGQPPTILQQLCSLPFTFFSDQKLVGVLFPTLICCCFKMQSNKTILEQELSSLLLSNFLEENLLREQSGNMEGSLVDRYKQSLGLQVNHRMRLATRFPRHLWQEAQLYFSNH